MYQLHKNIILIQVEPNWHEWKLLEVLCKSFFIPNGDNVIYFDRNTAKYILWEEMFPMDMIVYIL